MNWFKCAISREEYDALCDTLEQIRRILESQDSELRKTKFFLESLESKESKFKDLDAKVEATREVVELIRNRQMELAIDLNNRLLLLESQDRKSIEQCNLIDTFSGKFVDIAKEVERLQNQFDKIVKPILNNSAANMANKKPMRRKPENVKKA